MSGHVDQRQHEAKTVAPRVRADSPQEWIRAAFLLAGATFVIFAALWGVETATEWDAELAAGAVGAAAWVAAFSGLLGLSRQLRDDSARAGVAGVVLATLALVGAVVLAVGRFGELAGLWGERPAWLDPLNLLMFLGIIPGFLTVGIAGLRTGLWPKALCYMLLAPAAIFIINLLRLAIAEPASVVSAILGGAQAAVTISIAYLLGVARPSHPV